MPRVIHGRSESGVLDFQIIIGSTGPTTRRCNRPSTLLKFPDWMPEPFATETVSSANAPSVTIIPRPTEHRFCFSAKPEEAKGPSADREVAPRLLLERPRLTGCFF